MVSKEPEPKTRYEKPELVVVDLKAEEVLAVGCKMVGRTAVGSGAPPVCMANNCVRNGS
jgi:hypothetical protein